MSCNQHGPTMTTSRKQVVVATTAMSPHQSTAATSHNQAVAAMSHNQNPTASTTFSCNQVVGATSHNQHTAASTTSFCRSAVAMHSNTAINSATSCHDRVVEPSGQVVHNDNTNSGNEPDNDESDNAVIPPQEQTKQNSRNCDLHPHHLGFYMGTWYDVLVDVKNKYRFFVHTQDPFPEHNTHSLRDAHDCLLEAVVQFTDDHLLDEGIITNY